MGQISQSALEYAISKRGCKYSQPERMKDNIFDCSSLIYRAYKAAGYTYEAEHNTSMYLVYDTNFELIYPASHKALGQKFTSIAELKKQGYKPKPGDVIYINTQSNTSRYNKITHVVMVEDDKTIVHARGTAYGVRRDSIDLYGSKIVAVTRFIEDDDLKADDAPKLIRSAVCTGNSVNIRKTPSAAASDNILGAINKEHPLLVSGSGNWLRCVTLKGDKALDGYIFSDYVN